MQNKILSFSKRSKTISFTRGLYSQTKNNKCLKKKRKIKDRKTPKKHYKWILQLRNRFLRYERPVKGKKKNVI